MGAFTYDKCCKPANREIRTATHLAPSLKIATEHDNFRVDLLVRTHHGDQDFVDVLLDSVWLFWPMTRWQTKVFVVLDEDSEEDMAVCRRMPSFVDCRLEAPPDWWKRRDRNLNNGLVRAMWSLHYADRYSTAEYI